MYVVAVELGVADAFCAALKTAKVFHRTSTKQGEPCFAINNGKYYDRLYQIELWYVLFAALRANHASTASALTYLGVLTSRTLAIVNDRRTTAKLWMVLNIHVLCLAAAETIAIGNFVIKPAQFGLTKKLPRELMANRALEHRVGFPEDSLALCDTNSNAQFEASHRQTATSIHDGVRGGGAQSSVTKTLGPKLAAKTTPAANTIKAEAALTAAAGNLNREEFALRQVHEGGVEADAARSLSKTSRVYGETSAATQRSSEIDESLRPLLEGRQIGDVVMADAKAAASDARAAPAAEAGGGGGDDDGLADEDDDDDAHGDDADIVEEAAALGLAADDDDDVVNAETANADVASRGPRSVSSKSFASISIGDHDVLFETTAEKKITTTKDFVCIAFRVPGARFTSKVAFPFDAFESVYHDTGYLAMVLADDATPIFWIQYETMDKNSKVRRAWSKVNNEDPTKDRVASTYRAIVLKASASDAFTSVVKDCFEKIVSDGPKVRKGKLPVAERGVKYDPPKQAAKAAAAPDKGVKRINVRHFADAVVEYLLKVEETRLDFLGRLAAELPDVFDETAATAFEKRLRQRLEEIRAEFRASIAPPVDEPTVAEPTPMDQTV